MMALSDNLRGALYMNVAMAAFTLNDAGMKVATQSLPLFEAITLRGAITSVLLIGLGLGTGGLRHRLSRRDAGITGIRSLAEVGATLLFLTAPTLHDSRLFEGFREVGPFYEGFGVA